MHLSRRFIEPTARRTGVSAHIYTVAAPWMAEEGLQIRQGEISFPILVRTVAEYCPTDVLISEIWQVMSTGAKLSGGGFPVLDTIARNKRSVSVERA